MATAGLAGLVVASGLTGGSVRAPVAVVEAAQFPVAEDGFTAEQAAAGWSVYARQCGECHGIGLDGAEAPALRGVDFLNLWAGRTSDELFEYVRDGMPPGFVGMCYGNVQSRVTAREVFEYKDQRTEYKETVARIVEFGRAHHAAGIVRFLQEAGVEGFVVSTERVNVAGLED